MGFIDEIKAKAKSCKKTIVLPESEDIRTYEAAEAILKEGTANLILIGSEEEIAKNKGDFDITGATIVDPATYEKTDEYVATLVELRKKKGMTEEQAREILLTNYLYYGVMMVMVIKFLKGITYWLEYVLLRLKGYTNPGQAAPQSPIIRLKIEA